MKYKATAKFKTINRLNVYQELTRDEFNAFMAGKTIECNPTGMLIKNKYLEKAKVKNGN